MLNEWIHILLEDAVERIEAEIYNYKDDPLFAAYSDIWAFNMTHNYSDEIRKKFDNKFPKRKLNYRDKRWMSVKEYRKLMTLAANGLDNFDTRRVGVFFAKYSHLKYQPGREGSVVTYVKGFVDEEDVSKFAVEAMKRIKVNNILLYVNDKKLIYNFKEIKDGLFFVHDMRKVEILLQW